MSMKEACRPIAIRYDNALLDFIHYIEKTLSCPEADARAVAQAYIQYRLVTIDPAIGRYHVKHGTLLSRETLACALRNLKK